MKRKKWNENKNDPTKSKPIKIKYFQQFKIRLIPKTERARGREQGSKRKLWKNSQRKNKHNIHTEWGKGIKCRVAIQHLVVFLLKIGRKHSRTHK